MTTRTATLIIRYKDADGAWKRAAAVRGANGRISPGFALIAGKESAIREYQYQVRYYEDRKLRYESAGVKAGAADALRDRIEKQATAKAIAEDAGLKVETEEKRKSLLSTSMAYIKDAERRGAMEAAAQARNVSDEFLRVVRKIFVDEIARDDVFRFHEALRKRRCSDRTVANKHQRLTSWLRFAGIDKSILPPVPKYEVKLPTIYDRDQISTLLANADARKRIMILLGLKLGLRDQELQHADFGDVHWTDKTFRVQGKPKWGFRPKTREQREIPIPDDLLIEIKTLKNERSDPALIPGTATGRPNGSCYSHSRHWPANRS